MRPNKTLLKRNCLLAAAGLLFASGVCAQNFPARPLKLIMPFPPGGPTDAAGRLIAQKMSEGLGQQVVVETRAGGSGIPGTEAGAKAAPDGYTLIYGTTSTFSILPGLNATLPYDPRKSFAPVSQVSTGPILVAVHVSVPANTLRELIALAKAQPRTINFGSAGSGTVPHLAAELFKTLADVDIVHIPYKGSGPAMTDLVAGRIQVMFDALAPLIPNIRAGKLRALAVAGTSRFSALPEVPTAAEAGLPQFEVGLWNGVLAPAGTPRDVVAKLNATIRKALAEPGTEEVLTRYGLVPAGNTPEAFASFIEFEMERWGKVVKVSGAKME
ncbi:MAG: tripartite tricarboxylate transporter substrate binding protein [Betaproteobacteria bacterium]|nr:tripartite tricarboxylate transporter substrate binding protein [Betaproteobacteria bacterium]